MTDTPVDLYARAVIAGQVPAGRYHRLACERHLRDRAREGQPGFPYRFVWEERDAAGRLRRCALFAIEFIQQLRHYKGEWAGQLIVLQPYQVFRIGSLFGWYHRETGFRRFRTSYNEIPRKNGKSLEAAAVALLVAFFDGEPGAEGYCIATKRDQAKIVFNDAKKLVEKSGLKKRIAVQVANLHQDSTASKLEPLGADHDSTDGLNPNLVVVDEFHAHKDRGLIDVMETATGARRQPVMFQITTAGDNPVSPCGDQHDYACKILDQVIEDETFFAFIAHADPPDREGKGGDDWTDERTWRKANPNYGVSIKPDDLRALCRKATHMPSAAATFKQKRLNLWVNASSPCLSIDGWRRGQSDWKEEELAGGECLIGVDLASKIDLCSLSALFPPTPKRPTWRVIQRIWTPGDTLEERAHRDRAPYQVWADQGWLRVTPGTAVDHDLVRLEIVALRDRFKVTTIGFDPWQDATPIRRLIADHGFPEDKVLEVPQTFLGMSAACLRMQAEILGANVDARRCPVTAWSVSNVVDQRDGKDNMQFTKKKSRGRIDPVISMTIALALQLRQPATNPAGLQLMIFGPSSQGAPR